MRTTTLTTDDGFDLAVQQSGRDDGPMLLLLPGQANSHRWWDHLRGAFEQRWRVVTFDYRGTGGSRGPIGSWSTSSFAADARQVIDALGAASTCVYGTSMGGRVAQRLAIEHPQVVDRLVLACTSPGGAHASERSVEVRRSLAVGDPLRRREVLHELFYTPDWPHEPAQSTLLGDSTMTPDESRAHLRVSARHDAWDDLPVIRAATLVIHGTDDLLAPAQNAGVLAARIPGAALHLHEGGRHGFFEEFAGSINPLVESFLAGART